jgi:hypothetical protein
VIRRFKKHGLIAEYFIDTNKIDVANRVFQEWAETFVGGEAIFTGTVREYVSDETLPDGDRRISSALQRGVLPLISEASTLYRLQAQAADLDFETQITGSCYRSVTREVC